MDKIKIAYLVSTLKTTGPINILYGIVKYLDFSKFDVTIITLSKETKDSSIIDFTELDIKIIQLNMSRLKGIIANQKTVQNIINIGSIDIVHSHGLRADKINSNLVGVKSLITIHNFPDDDYLMKFGKIKGKLMVRAHKKAIKHTKYAIACSKSISEKFKYNYNINVDYIQNGIDIEKYSAPVLDKKEIRKFLNLPIDKNIFTISGSLIARKSPITILEYIRDYKKENDFFLFLGAGALYESLKENYSSECVRFSGNVKNVNKYLFASDYYLSASLSEGLPNSVLEAMNIGLPVILSDISPHKEIVGDDYKYLFTTKNSNDLADKIEVILKDNWEDISSKCKEIVTKNFTAEIMSNKYQYIYIECLNTEE